MRRRTRTRIALAGACALSGVAGWQLADATGEPLRPPSPERGPVSALRLRLIEADLVRDLRAQIGSQAVREAACSAQTTTQGSCLVRLADDSTSLVDLTIDAATGEYRWQSR